MSSKKLNPFKDFQSDQIQSSSRKVFTAHYACRNAALNLIPVTGTTNGFIFQIINSLMESYGVRLTWFDCNTSNQIRVKYFTQPSSTRCHKRVCRSKMQNFLLHYPLLRLPKKKKKPWRSCWRITVQYGREQ